MPELSEEETELVTEYAAGLMLKYDTRYSSKGILNDDELEAMMEKEAAQREKERAYAESAKAYQESLNNKQTEDASQTETVSHESSDPTISNIASFFGIDGFDVAYSGYELCDSYPSSGDSLLMAMDASEGKQLLVVNFNVANVSSDSGTFDMFYKSPGFTLNVNGDTKVRQQATLLLDDMAAYNGTIGMGSSENMVLIFEVGDDISSISSLVLTAKNGSEKGSITLQ